MSSSYVPCKFGKACPKFPNCKFYHSPENTPDCPFMTSSQGCTNLQCKYRHPPGFVHACIWGINCTDKKCPYVHPMGKLCEQHPKPKKMNLDSCHKTSECNSRQSTLCKYGDDCNHKDTCPFTHPNGKNTNVECPFMTTPRGCTNLKCTYWHPKGFVHACAFGMQCRKHATGQCNFLHPDERGFGLPASVEHPQPALVPRREAPSPPSSNVSLPNQNTHLEKDEYGHYLVYNDKNEIIGIYDNCRFISFIPNIPHEVQEADRAWDAEMNDYDPSENEWETDPEAYSDHSETSENPDDACDWDEWETDPEVYGFPADS